MELSNAILLSLLFLSSCNLNYAATFMQPSWRRNLSITASTPPPQVAAPSKPGVFLFKPSIIVIVGVLTIIFFITFVLLLYAKHCKRGSSSTYDFTAYPPVFDRKNSGVERAVVESLPVFRFESFRGRKDGMECAVCLNRFEDNEDLRLLPKCMHGFHVECVDTWLDAHASCPLCRNRINSGEFPKEEEYRICPEHIENVSVILPMVENSSGEVVVGASRVKGRHSFAGRSPEVILETERRDSAQAFFVGRRSLDSWIFRKIASSETTVVGCFERPRKDGLLLADCASSTEPSMGQWRLDHCSMNENASIDRIR